MPPPEAAVLCPACGARNKPKWEFCARCGESLQGAAPATPPPVAATAGKVTGKAGPGRKGGAAFTVSRSADTESSSARNAALAAVALVALLGTAVFAYRSSVGERPSGPPDPTAFAIPTLPPKPVAAEPRPGEAGQKAFQEGHRLLSAGEAEAALPLLAQAVSEGPENGRYHWSYGEALMKTGSLEAALDAMGEATRLDPARFRRDYAKNLGTNGRGAQAAAEFEAMLEAAPDDAEALRGAGWYLCQQKNFDKGLPLLMRAAELREGDASILDSLAAMQATKGDYSEAAITYGQIVLLFPSNHDARMKLADVLLISGRPAQAVEAFQRAVAKEPDSPRLRRDLGSVLERAGRRAEAAAAYREYARLAPEAADAPEMLRKAARLAPAS